MSPVVPGYLRWRPKIDTSPDFGEISKMVYSAFETI